MFLKNVNFLVIGLYISSNKVFLNPNGRESKIIFLSNLCVS